jgi:hypothetical protein
MLTLSAQVEAGTLSASAALVQYAAKVLDADDAAAIKAEVAAMQSLGLQPKPMLGSADEFGSHAPTNLADDL